MVKGISKRVVVVKTPINSIFDEAIFILNESADSSVNAENILREACLLADGYVRRNCPEKQIPKKLLILLTASLSALFIAVCLAIYFALK